MPSYLETAAIRQAGGAYTVDLTLRRHVNELAKDKTTVRNIYTASTATWNYQQDISLERLTLWPITNRLYIGIVPMDVIGLQKQCEMGCDLSTLGQTLRPRASQMRVEVPRMIKTHA